MLRKLFGVIAVLSWVLPSLQAATVQFNARQDISTQAKHLFGLAIADFNGDGKLDIAITDDYTQTLSVYLNDGTGKFGAPVQTTFTVPSIGGFGALAVGDLNEDGKPDLIVGPIAGLQYDVVLLGNGDGTFTEQGQIAGSYSFLSSALLDLTETITSTSSVVATGRCLYTQATARATSRSRTSQVSLESRSTSDSPRGTSVEIRSLTS